MFVVLLDELTRGHDNYDSEPDEREQQDQLGGAGGLVDAGVEVCNVRLRCECDEQNCGDDECDSEEDHFPDCDFGAFII